MATWNRKLGRTAGRLYDVYAAQTQTPRCEHLPETTWNTVRRSLRNLDIAHNRGWHTAAERQKRLLVEDLQHLATQVCGLMQEWQSRHVPRVPTLRELYDELSATEEEFGGLEREGSEIVVTTEAITLEGIRLGRFQIRLDRDRIGDERSYKIVALEPNPASSHSGTTHPHVHDERLCPGEGRAAIAAALQEGRLSDFFTIVNRVLHTYAAGSAYVELDQWHGVPCQDCDCQLDEDDACSCPSCDHTLCCDCQVVCESCSTGSCSDCSDRCARCENRHCSGCLTSCGQCGHDVCDSCLEEGLCVDCHEAQEPEDEAANDETETTPDCSAEPPLQPDRVGQAVVSA